jgi:hypothetical protein
VSEGQKPAVKDNKGKDRANVAAKAAPAKPNPKTDHAKKPTDERKEHEHPAS